MNSVGDQSPYVSQLAATLRHSVPHVRDNLAASRKYYTQFCLKFVTAFMPRFVAALYRCRPATTGVTHASASAAAAASAVTDPGVAASQAAGLDGDAASASAAAADVVTHSSSSAAAANIMGCEQLLLDTHSIKTILLELPSIGSQVRRKAPASYTKVVLRGMAQPEAIVKLCMAPIGGAHAAYAEQYARMLPGSTVAEFGRVLEMKAVVRRADQV